MRTEEFDRWLEDVPVDHVSVDQCCLCGALVANWVPVIADPDQRSAKERHEETCPGKETG